MLVVCKKNFLSTKYMYILLSTATNQVSFYSVLFAFFNYLIKGGNVATPHVGFSSFLMIMLLRGEK